MLGLGQASFLLVMFEVTDPIEINLILESLSMLNKVVLLTIARCLCMV